MIEEFSKNLETIILKEMPAKNKACPCGSKLRYKKCCEVKDLLDKSNLLDKIEEVLSKKEN